MNWLSRVRNAIPFIAKRETEGNLWHKCPSCAQMIYTKEYEENLSVCPVCNHHGRIGPKARFPQIFDNARFTVLPTPSVAEDPLKFRDTKRYTDRIKAARTSTGERDALINAVVDRGRGRQAASGSSSSSSSRCGNCQCHQCLLTSTTTTGCAAADFARRVSTKQIGCCCCC